MIMEEGNNNHVAMDVTMTAGRKGSLTGDSEADLSMLQQRKDEALTPMKEDLADWLQNTLSIDITADTFMDALDNGVYVCKLAELIHTKALEWRSECRSEEDIPQFKIRYRKNAQSGSFFARDNTACFLKWCRAYGVKDECLFESEGLVLHKQPRSVIVCLLELARIGMKYGLEPPHLIKMETEIEKEEEEIQEIHVPELKKVKVQAQRPESGKLKKKQKTDDIDVEVQRQTSRCQCPNCFKLTRISEGKYNIGGKVLFIRMLKGKHVMVRVGGGWDTLQHYIQTHDPCRIMEMKRAGSKGSLLDADEVKRKVGSRAGSMEDIADEKFLVIKGRYKGVGKKS
ncbi:unnamed protein product [Owenia fusiformis]|nr:unnamed protein product [Owenia fusiformis]